MHGYHGRYLRIDVTTGSAEPCDIPESVLRKYVGGVGLGTWLLMVEGAAAVDPYSAAGPLIFAFSPLVGSPLTTSAKFAVLCKSPLTDRLNDSLCSSRFALAGKRTGFDALVIRGRAPRRSCLVVTDRGVQLLEAGDLWGLPVPDATRIIRHRHGREMAGAVIGPAGERGVRYATISHDGRHAGRGGSGAVMGAKNLKAILVGGDRRVRFAHPDALATYAKDVSQRSFGPATAKYRELGTVGNLLVFNRLKTLPTRNFQAGSFAAAEALSGEQLGAAYTRVRQSCAACTIGCEHLFADAGGSRVRLEYESVFALGPLCGIGDVEAVRKASGMCDDYGLDTISAGGTLAFVMDCTERGLWPHQPLRFGDGEGVLRSLQQIARGEGDGPLLGQGSRRIAATLPAAAAELAMHVKGLEFPGYEPRGMQTMALGFAVAARGADHNRSGAYQADLSPGSSRFALSSGSAAAVIESENEAALLDSLILCKFLRGVFPDRLAAMGEMLQLVTGWSVQSEQLEKIAARIINAKRHFNVLAGWTADEDRLPARFLDQAVERPGGLPIRIDAVSLSRAIAKYYQQRGWSRDGGLDPGQIRDLEIDG